MTKAAVALAEIRETRTAPRITRSGLTRPEREDSPGTPWLAFHKPSVADGSYALPVMMLGTLRACRILAADGTLDQSLARRKADPDAARLAALLAAQKG